MDVNESLARQYTSRNGGSDEIFHENINSDRSTTTTVASATTAGWRGRDIKIIAKIVIRNLDLLHEGKNVTFSYLKNSTS